MKKISLDEAVKYSNYQHVFSLTEWCVRSIVFVKIGNRLNFVVNQQYVIEAGRQKSFEKNS